MISAVFLAGPKVYIYVDYYFGNLQIDYVCRASIQHILQQQNIEINPREFKRHESFWVDVYKSTCELKSKVTASYIKCIFERNFPSAQAQLWICRKGYKVHHLFLGGCRLPFCSQVTLVVCGCWMQNEIARDCLALSLSLSLFANGLGTNAGRFHSHTWPTIDSRRAMYFPSHPRGPEFPKSLEGTSNK